MSTEEQKTVEEAPPPAKDDAASSPPAAPAVMDEAAQIAGIKERLNFFFSNANVRQDNFIRKFLLKEEDGSAGSVPVDTLLKFNTIKKFTTDAGVVAKAARALPDLLVMNDNDTEISRKEPFTKDMMDGHIPVTLYLQNLPLKEVEERVHYDTSIDEISKLFEPYGTVAMVKLRFSTGPKDKADYDLGLCPRHRSYKKKKSYPLGHAMVEFETTEAAEKAAAATLTMKDGKELEPATPLEVGEAKTKLSVMMLGEYLPLRKEEKEKEDKERKDNKRKSPDGEDNEDEKELPKFEIDWKPGCVIKLKGLSESCDRESLLEAVSKSLEITLDDVKERKIYVDYSRGQTDGAIRFKEPSDDVKKVVEKLKAGEHLIKDSKPEDALILEGDEEKEYWEKFIEFKTKQMRHRFEERNSKKRKKFYRK